MVARLWQARAMLEPRHSILPLAIPVMNTIDAVTAAYVSPRNSTKLNKIPFEDYILSNGPTREDCVASSSSERITRDEENGAGMTVELDRMGKKARG